jgi:hypothetical protein
MYIENADRDMEKGCVRERNGEVGLEESEMIGTDKQKKNLNKRQKKKIGKKRREVRSDKTMRSTVER